MKMQEENSAGIDKKRLDELYEIVKHDLHYREAVGDLIPGELEPSDIVDAVVLRAGRERHAQASPEKITERLRELATRQIESEAARVRRERDRAVHIEEDIPETAPEEEVKYLGEDTLYFYQPDEDLKMEDVLPGARIPSPERAVEMRELQECFAAALNALPREWRQALRLRYRDGLSGARLATAMHRSEQDCERILERATAYLRQRLLESGCDFDQADPQSLLPFDTKLRSERDSRH